MKDALVSYRLEQAEVSLKEAVLLLNTGKSFRGAVNRDYYAMFYAVLALLSKSGGASSRHSGIIGRFDKNFVKKGVFSKEMSKDLHRAFDLRQMSDYRELFNLNEKDAREIIQSSQKFVKAIKEYLQEHAD